MKVNRVLFLCSAIALPQLAMAGLSDTNPAGLGDVHALLSFCAQADPRDATAFQTEWASITGGASGKQLDSVEDGGPYKQAYDELMATLTKLPRQEASSICGAAAAAWNGTGTSSGGDDDRGGGGPDHRKDGEHR